MAVQNVIGDSFRGATWVALHNGGGVGWGEVMNGGFGLVVDGSEEASRNAECMLSWDVSNGVNIYFNLILLILRKIKFYYALKGCKKMLVWQFEC